MNDVITLVQGGTERQHRVFSDTVLALKFLFSSLPGDSKDSVSSKKIKAGEEGGGDWTCVEEVLGWTINTQSSTVALPKQKI